MTYLRVASAGVNPMLTRRRDIFTVDLNKLHFNPARPASTDLKVSGGTLPFLGLAISVYGRRQERCPDRRDVHIRGRLSGGANDLPLTSGH